MSTHKISFNYHQMHLILGFYFTGDGAYRSEAGHYQITGRMDDVLNVSGHRLGTAEIEDAIVRLKFHSYHIRLTHICNIL